MNTLYITKWRYGIQFSVLAPPKLPPHYAPDDTQKSALIVVVLVNQAMIVEHAIQSAYFITMTPATYNIRIIIASCFGVFIQM